MDTRDIREDEALVQVTYDGRMGDMPSPVPIDATDAQIRAWATEAVRSGTIRGIAADQHVNFSDFVVERFGATADRSYAIVMLRPKATFGTT